MAKLRVLISDGGDGSYHPVYVLDDLVIKHLQDAYDQGRMDYENGYGVDGDGFHYSTIIVPDDSTAASLGVDLLTIDEVQDFAELED